VPGFEIKISGKIISSLESRKGLPPFCSTLVSKAIMDRRWLDKIDSRMIIVRGTT